MTAVRRLCALLMVLLIGVAVVAASGCGTKEEASKKISQKEDANTGGESELAYDDSPENPVVIYRTSQAIAPVYNPDAPKVIIFGDGTLVKKEGPYTFSASELDDGVQGVLDALEKKGFYELDEEYPTEEPLAGGTTEYLTVNLADSSHTVTVESGATPPSSWSDIKDLVESPPSTEIGEYVPDEVVLYANPVTEQPGGSTERQWPGDPSELAGASSESDTQKADARLEGESANTAWEAVQEAFEEDGGDTVWNAGGKLYTYVYATPVFPGVEE